MANKYFQSTCNAGFKDCRMVIDAMVHALTASNPKTRYLLVSSMEMFFFSTFPLLPTFITDGVFKLSPLYHKRKVMLYSGCQ